MWTVPSTTLNVSESEAVGFVIGTIAATDVDAVDTSLQYEITSGLITNEFAVVGEGMSCNLTVGETGLDFEKKRLYTLSISATDNGGLVTSSTVVVNVEDGMVVLTTRRPDYLQGVASGGSPRVTDVRAAASGNVHVVAERSKISGSDI